MLILHMGGRGITITMVIGSHDTLITGLLSTIISVTYYSQETETTLTLVVVTGAPPEYPTIDNRRSHTIHLQWPLVLLLTLDK